MKPTSTIIAGTALVVALAACQQDGDESSASGRNRFGYRGTVEANQTQFATPSPTPDPFATPTPAPVDPMISATPTPTPSTIPGATQMGAREIAYGTPVPGKPGFVTSPHSPYAGYVDVRGFPPGTEVKCPYSGKIFLVP
ncbi:MAG: hypothetical protein SFU53_05480 [Terrimicrobiaceae bacterium]|nr:hypothetical protein [Terrimicrobiaceae bacterium]